MAHRSLSCYDAFGSVVGKTAYVTDPLTGQTILSAVIPEELTYGYTGKWQRDKDLATGTIRMGVREYDPQLGRFISPDLVRGNAGNPQSRNRYAYALNDPLVYQDLDGQSAAAAAAAAGIFEVSVFMYAYNKDKSVEEAHGDLADALDREASETWEGMQGAAQACWNGVESVGSWFDEGSNYSVKEGDEFLNDILDQGEREGRILDRDGSACEEFDRLKKKPGAKPTGSGPRCQDDVAR